MGQYGHFTLVRVSWYEIKVFCGLTGDQRDTLVLGRHTYYLNLVFFLSFQYFSELKKKVFSILLRTKNNF